MARPIVTTRTLASRDPIHPQTYNVTVYGDSFSDSGGGTGWIGETLNTQTTSLFRYREQATGGDLVSEIRTAFEADFPHAGGNFVVIQGYINSIRTDVLLSSIQTDITAMADAVIANGNYGLAIVLQTPWYGHAEWTQARQDVTDQLNAWILHKYPDYAVDINTALGDPTNPLQLADEFYKAARTDAHPSYNGDVVIDDKIGELLFYRSPTITRDADAGNVFPYPNTPSLWGNNLRITIGGNSILMCDGTYSNSNGLIADTNTISAVARHAFTAPTAAQPCVAKALVKAGWQRWVKFEYKDNDGNINMNYFDIVNVAVGATGTGAFIPAITKAAKGWVEISLTGTTGAGSGGNWINLNPSEANGDENYVGDDRTPGVYIDRVQLVL